MLNDHHENNAAKERFRLAARALAALRDLAELDPSVIELAGIAATELDALYPGVHASAGPDDPVLPPKKP